MDIPKFDRCNLGKSGELFVANLREMLLARVFIRHEIAEDCLGASFINDPRGEAHGE